MSSEPTNAPPVLLRPHHAVAERVLCPGDPGRALRLAQALTTGVPPMLNHHRGLWGYGATAADGRPLTVQATGVGGPSAALVVGDLVALGARRLVRVGTATAADPGLALGSVLAVRTLTGRDGTSRALGGAPTDRTLTSALAAGADAAVALQSADPGGPDAGPGPAATDLQSAAFVAAAAHGGAAAGVLVIVAVDARGARISDAALHVAEARAGRLALAALG